MSIETNTKEKVVIEIDNEILQSAEEQSYTFLHCKYTTSPEYLDGWWVNIYKTSCLICRGANENLEMLHALNIPLAPEKHYFKRFGDTLTFTLIFPKVPKTWNVFDFIEKSGGGGLRVLGIRRNSSGIYRVAIL